MRNHVRKPESAHNENKELDSVRPAVFRKPPRKPKPAGDLRRLSLLIICAISHIYRIKRVKNPGFSLPSNEELRENGDTCKLALDLDLNTCSANHASVRTMISLAC